MDADQFWNFVDAARAEAGPANSDGGEAVSAALVKALAVTDVPTVLEFRLWFDRFHKAAYRWDLWAAAYLIGGGCSDDGFIDFRAGLVSLGRDWYERAAADPDALAGFSGEIESEGFTYAAGDAYKQLTGDEGGFYDALAAFEEARGGRVPHPEVMGEDFDFDDDAEMRRRFPRLFAVFGS